MQQKLTHREIMIHIMNNSETGEQYEISGQCVMFDCLTVGFFM